VKGETAAADKTVNGELERVLKAAGLERSPVLMRQVDYMQFRPRGHHTRSEILSRYFRAYRYVSTALFYVVDSPATGITSQEADQLTGRALALARAITGDKELAGICEKFNARWDWTFGRRRIW
jgi:hypothetical protein